MELPVSGLIAQMKGIPAKHRYKYATVFVEHCSRYAYVVLMKSITGQEKVEAKISFEGYMASMGITFQHYYAENSKFADNTFLCGIKEKQQGITFCGVGAHFQNGIVGKKYVVSKKQQEQCSFILKIDGQKL